MLDRIRPRRTRAVLVAAWAAPLLAVLGTAAPASAGAPDGPSPGPVAQAIGGPQLASRGVVANYPSGSVPRLPDIKESAFVIADASTGQVLAAKDPHGWYRPASTLKVLTAIALIPVLNPDGTVVASKQATSTVPNVVGLVAGRAYRISGLFTALLTISANDAAIALTQQPSSSPSASAAAAPPARAAVASGSHGGSSVLAVAGFSCAVVLAAVLGFAYSRRQKLRASRASDRPARDRV